MGDITKAAENNISREHRKFNRSSFVYLNCFSQILYFFFDQLKNKLKEKKIYRNTILKQLKSKKQKKKIINKN